MITSTNHIQKGTVTIWRQNM